MKILAISGGTPNGNNDCMAKEALMGAAECGAEVEFIRLLDLELKPCTGCNACTTSLLFGGKGDCVLKDDFAWLDDKVLEADGVLFVMPIFESGAPSIFKILQDRMFGPSHSAGTNLSAAELARAAGKEGPDERRMKKRAVGFIALGGSEWSSRIAAEFNAASMVMLWKRVDTLVFQWSSLAILDDEIVAACRRLGRQLAEAAKDIDHAEYCGEPGICPRCHSRNFEILKDGTARCEACNLVGSLVAEDGRIVGFSFDQELVSGAHDTVSGRLAHREDMARNREKLMAAKRSDEYKARVKAYKDFIQPIRPVKE